jgi:hypothetical protein
VIDGWLASSAPPGKARQGDEKPDGWRATSIFFSEVAGEANGKIVVFKLVVDGSILTAGMHFTLVMGAVGGLVPAAVWMGLRPLESLRQGAPTNPGRAKAAHRIG